MSRDAIIASGVLAGTIIGAGIFSLPFLIAKVGMLAGVLLLAFFAGVYIAIHRMFAAVVESNREYRQFAGLAREYLPRWLASPAGLIIFFELLAVLVVYLAIAPSFMGIAFGVSGIAAALIFWALATIPVFFKLSSLGIAELSGVIAVIAIIFIVFGTGFSGGAQVPLSAPLVVPGLLALFGPLLFSLSGRPAIPELIRLHRAAAAKGRPFSLSSVITLGTLVPALLYLLFVVGVLMLSPDVTPDALTGIAGVSPLIRSLLGMLGLVALWTSYLTVGVNVKEMLEIDWKVPRAATAVTVVAVPLFIVLLVNASFLSLLSFVGGVFLALEGLFVVFLWRGAFPGHPMRPWTIPLTGVFVFALVYELASIVL